MELYSTPDNPLAVHDANCHGAAVEFEAIPASGRGPYVLLNQAAPGIPGLEPEKVKLALILRPGTSMETANWIASELNSHVEGLVSRREE